MGSPISSSLLLQTMLQSAVQSVQWTYTLFWQFQTQQRMLVWADGYYNGAIKTRKTVQPMEVSTEEASLHRSQQLKDLYDSLSTAAGDSNQPLRRPCAALSPEDLTESEWFYLMCISFSFPPGVGLPGKAYATRQHVWITGANEIDSRTFSRAILAKSAHIKTVVCIPLMDGVVELGTTLTVKEDCGFIQHIRSIFSEPHYSRPPKPALSEVSTSNSATSFDHCNNLYSSPVPAINDALQLPENQQEEDHGKINSAADSDFATETTHGRCPSSAAVAAVTTAGEPSELMQLELPKDICVGSPDDGSNNLDADVQWFTMPQSGNSEDIQLLADSYKNESEQRRFMLREPSNHELQPPPRETLPGAELTDEDTHYSHMISTILQNQQSDSSTISGVICSSQSAFSKWTSHSDLHHIPVEGSSTSQWLLKHILHKMPLLHSKHCDETSSKSRGSQWKEGTPEDELSGNHVLAERRHREKLNEKFIILRSMVPFGTKTDTASILGDTIEYVKQLRKKIQDLEAHTRKMENDQSSSLEELQRIATASRTQCDQPSSDKRKLRILESVGGGGIKHKVLDSPVHPPSSSTSKKTNLQVSIIETDGLLELQCPYKEGLLLNIMQILQELWIETTSVQSSLSNGVFVAELRAKVKKNMNGKKASIMDVKRAIQQIIPNINT